MVRRAHRRRTAALGCARARPVVPIPVFRPPRRHRPVPSAWSRRGYDVAALENVYTGDQVRVSLDRPGDSGQDCQPVGDARIRFLRQRRTCAFHGAGVFAPRAVVGRRVCGHTRRRSRSSSTESPRWQSQCGFLRRPVQRRCRRPGDRHSPVFASHREQPGIPTAARPRSPADRQQGVPDCARFHRRHEPAFPFRSRFRALLGGHRSDIIRDIEQGFPRLPSGCSIQLDRVASKIVLDNVRGSLGSTFASLVAELRAIADARRQAGGDPASISLADFLRDAALEIDDLYKSSGWTWSRLRGEAGLPTLATGPEQVRVARAIPRLLHLDDPGASHFTGALSMASCQTVTSISRAPQAVR